MARNGTGTYVLPAGQPVVINTTVSSTVFNTLTSDLATALTTSVCTDGQTPMTGHLPMGTHKVTGLSDGSLSTDAVNKGQMDTADAAVTTAYIAADATIAAATQGRNMLNNSRMIIATRANTYALTTSVAYGSIDQWAASMGATAAGIWNRVTAPAQSSFLMVGKLGRNNASTSTGVLSICQPMESIDAIAAAGSTVILSFYAYKGANFSATSDLITAKVISGTGTNESAVNLVAGSWTGSTNVISQTQALTTTLTRYTFTGTVASTAIQLGVVFSYTPTGTAGADDNLYITGIQLEIARAGQTAASALERVSTHDDAAKCKRYLETSYVLGTAPGTVTTTGQVRSMISTSFLLTNGHLKFSVSKLSTPTVTIYSPNTGTAARVGEYDTASAFVADRVAVVSETSNDGFVTTINATGTPGSQAWWHFAASSEF